MTLHELSTRIAALAENPDVRILEHPLRIWQGGGLYCPLTWLVHVVCGRYMLEIDYKRAGKLLGFDPETSEMIAEYADHSLTLKDFLAEIDGMARAA